MIGAMLRWMTAGESHGEALTALIEGVPAGVQITTDTIRAALARRRLGHGRGARQAFEADESPSWAGSATGAPWAGPWPSSSATPSGPRGPPS